ncbi:signal peptide peptidase SppA [Aquamicrobium sp.]|uniref:signal peptide peptidase SppA n=1 Tax=Aquamicrobium sp. TaxID=1872579 RepID=UPI002590C796|nr:signal peptide peptidase SppA [Aquamicrobium sp.]MCK9549771.1 signal peptide peptidase SppA [Aquamicrobium sp.]
MVFARKFWKLLVAIKDGLALLFLLLFFMMLYAALTTRPTAASIREGALLMRLDGAIVEEASLPDPLQTLLASEAPAQEYAARDLVRALRLAEKDKRVKAVAVDLSRFTGGGFVSLRDVGAAMDRVRAAKKPVLVYAVAYTDDGVQLAAHASEVWVHPLGGAFVRGPGGSSLYFAQLLDKLKVTAHVFRVGTYKSAVEPFMLDRMSDASREQLNALAAAMWDNWKSDVARARPKADIALATDDPVAWVKTSGGDIAKAALAAGLVDRIGDEREFGKRVAALAGEDKLDKAPGAFAHTPLATYLRGHQREKGGKAIGVVTVAGDIVDGDAGPGTAGGDRIAALLDDALDDDLAALVVRVDSPGGSVLASEQIRSAVARHKARGIPVVVSMANMAASGGYWVSTTADRIFAEPGTLTGSIGVFAVLPSFERALGHWGITADGVTTTPLSGQPDLAGGLNPAVKALLQTSVEGTYSRFLDIVGQSRGKPPAEIDRIAQGRVWDGGTARQLGLVDEFGSIDSALAYAAGKAGLKDGEWHVRHLETPPDAWVALLQQFGGQSRDDSEARKGAMDWPAIVAEGQRQTLLRALTQARRLATARGTQAYCLECQPVRSITPREEEGSLRILARFERLLGI